MQSVIYLRQSKDFTGEGLGVERQEAECRRLCEQRGYTVTEVITDNAVSATRGERPGYQHLIELIERRAVDVVVVLRVDRLLRRLTDLEQLIELSERTGVQIATVSGDIDLSSSSGRLVGRLLASVARAEVETKSERQILAYEQAARAGKPHGSRRPYGYEADLVTIKDDEAAVLREMARRIIAGHAFREVAWWANSQGHTTTTGKLWYSITVRNMLRKPRYAGIREYKGAQFKAQWPAVFDEQVWEQLQLALRLRAETVTDRPKARKYLLTGLVFCGRCGSPLNGQQSRDRASAPVRRNYLCKLHGSDTRARGCGLRRGAEPLDDYITELVLAHTKPDQLLKPDDEVIRDLLADRDRLNERLDAIADDYGSGILSRSQFMRANTAARAELTQLNDDIERYRHQRGIDIPLGEDVRLLWEQSESDEWKRSLLASVIKRIVVNPGNSKPKYVTRDGRAFKFDPALIEVEWQ